MSKYSNTIEYLLSTKLDKTGITQLQTELSRIQTNIKTLSSQGLHINTASALKTLSTFQEQLQKSYNSTLGIINKQQLMPYLPQTVNTLRSLGAEGVNAGNKILATFGKFDTQMNRTSSTMDKIANTFGNTFRWGIIASGFQYMMNSIHSSVQYMADLDASLTNIRMVTDYTKEDMREFALYANEAAKALGNTTVAYTNAALIYAQAGYSLPDQKALAGTTLKVANTTGMDAATASEQMIALINGYQMSVDELDVSLDKLAKIANISAADLQELATAEARVASTAYTLGVSQESLGAQIGTIVSVTREAPEVVGNSLKTMYSRIADVKMGNSLEDGVDYGKYTKTLKAAGIDVLQENGELKEMDDLIEEIMSKWETLTTTQQESLAATVAGRYQMNRFMALMNNSEMYYQYKGSAEGSAGTLDIMNEEYLESLQGKAQSLQATFEGLMTTLFNQDDFGGVIDGLTQALDLLKDFVEAIGGGQNALILLGSVATKVFSKQIASGVASVFSNKSLERMQSLNREVQARGLMENYVTTGSEASQQRSESFRQDLIQGAQVQSFSSEQQDTYNKLLERRLELENNLNTKEEQLAQSQNALRAGLEILIGTQAVENDLTENGALSIDKLRGTVNALDESFLNVSASLSNNESFTKIFSEIQRVVPNILNLAESAQTLNGSKQAFDELAIGVDVATEALGMFIQENQNAPSSLKQLHSNMEQLLQAMTEYNSVLNKTDATSEEVTKAQTKLGMTVRSLETEGNSLVKIFNILASGELPQTIEGFDALIQSVNSASEAARQAGVAHRDYITQVGQLQDKIQSFTKSVSNITQLAMGFNMLGQALNTLQDPDTTALEKINALMMEGLMAVSLIVPAIANFKTTLMGLFGVTQKGLIDTTAAKLADAQATSALVKAEYRRWAIAAQNVIAMGLENTAGGQDIITRYEKVAAIYSEVKAEEKAIETQLAEAKAGAINNGVLKENILTKLKSIPANLQNLAVTLGLIKAKASETVVENINTKATIKNTLAKIANRIATLGWIAIIIAATVAVTALAVAIYKMTDPVERSKAALEESSEKAKVAAQNYAKAKEDADAALSAMSDYQDARKALDSLTKGTKEWDEQVLKINDHVLQLLQIMPQLAQYVHSDDGVLSIDQEGMDSFIRSQNAKVIASQQSVISATERKNADVERNMAETAARRSGVGLSADQLIEAAEALNSGSIDLGEQSLQEFFTTQFGVLPKNIDAAAAAISELAAVMRANTTAIESQNQALDTQIASVAGGDAYTEATHKEATADYIEQQVRNTDVSAQMSAYGSRSVYYVNGQAQFGDNGSLYDSGKTEYAHRRYGTEAYVKDNKIIVGDQEIEVDWGEAYKELELALQMDAYALEDHTEEIKNYDENYKEPYSGHYDANLGQDTSQRENILNTNYEVDEEVLNATKETLNSTTELGRAEQEAASKRDLASEGIERYKKAQELLQQQYKNGRISLEEYSKGAKELSENLEEQESIFDETSKTADHYNEELENLAARTLQTEEAAKKINDIFDKNAEILKSSTATTSEYIGALTNMRQPVADLFNVSSDLISDDFIINNLDSIKAAAQGDVEAFKALRLELSRQLIANIDVEGDEEARENLDTIKSKAEEFAAMDLEVGASINDEAFINALIEMVATGEDATGEIQDYLNSLGLELDYEVSNVEALEAIEGIIDGIAQVASAFTDPEKAQSWAAQKKGVYRGMFMQVHNVGSEGIQRHGSSTGSGSGSGSGGNGGSSKSYEPKTKEAFKDQADRYRDVNNHIQESNKSLSKLSNLEDRLVGNKLLDNLEAQSDELETQAGWYQKKLDLQKEELEESKKPLARDFGITFNKDGSMKNFEEVRAASAKEIQDAIDKYNAATTEADQEHWQKIIDERTKRHEELLDLAGKYDELLYNSIPETEESLEDIRQQLEDIAEQKWTVQLEVKLDKRQLREDTAYLDNLSLFGGFDSTDRSLDMAQREYKLASLNVGGDKKTLDELFAAAADGSYLGMNEADFFDKYKEEVERTIDDIKDKESAANKQYEKQLNAITEILDEQNEKIEERARLYDRLNDKLEWYQEVSELIYGDEAYEVQNAFMEKQMELNTQNIDEYQKEFEYQNKIVANLKAEQAQTEKGGQAWKDLQEEIKEAQSKADTAEDKIHDLQLESAKLAQDIMKNNVSKSIDAMNKQLFGTDIDWLTEEWEMLNKNADKYLDETNKAYEIQKLQSQYLDLLDNADGLGIQKQITDQMNEQLNKMRNKVNLSEYDVKWAQMQLEILQKRIALEDAQANKNQLKLRRDAQGNYSYMYTADQSNVRSAEQDLLDSQNSAYNLSKDRMVDIQKDSLSALKDAQNKVSDIWLNTTIDIEERNRRAKIIIDDLKNNIAQNSEDLTTAQANLVFDFVNMVESLIEDNKGNLADIAEQVKAGNTDMFDQIDERYSTSLTEWLGNLSKFESQCNITQTALLGYATDFENKLKTTLGYADTDLQNFAGNGLKAASEGMKGLADSQHTFWAEAEKSAESIADATKGLRDYEAIVNQLKGEVEALTAQIKAYEDQVNKKNSGAKSYDLNARESMGTTAINFAGGLLNGKTVDQAQKDTHGLEHYNKQQRTDIAKIAQAAIQVQRETGERDISLIIDSWITQKGTYGKTVSGFKFDTGGYTGTWSDSSLAANQGKLAFLHQKELVLNQQDTQNILNVVDIVRQLASSLQSGALASTLSSLTANAASVMTNQSQLQQDVHIDATFPNVKSADEIENALLSLVDQASVYAHQKRK